MIVGTVDKISKGCAIYSLGFFFIFAILIIVGYRTQLSAILLAIFCMVTAIIFHLDFANQMQVIALLKNFGLAGGFIFIAINGPKDWALDRKKNT